MDWCNLIWFPSHIPRFSVITLLAIKGRLNTRKGWLGMDFVRIISVFYVALVMNPMIIYSLIVFSPMRFRIPLLGNVGVRDRAKVGQVCFPLFCKGKSTISKLLRLCFTNCVYGVWQKRNNRIF